MNTEIIKLLELAAKAAGLKLDPYYKADEYSQGLMLFQGQREFSNLWKPHIDDAQCLQLARQLGINIDFTVDKCAWKRTSDGQMLQEFFDQNCEGWHKTDREAVVAVAAELGKLT